MNRFYEICVGTLFGVVHAFAAECDSDFSSVVFTDVTESAGVSYVQHYPNGLNVCFLQNWPGGLGFCEPERMTGGAAVGDYDGDGWQDLYVTVLTGEDILYRNNGDGTFSDVTEAAGLRQTARTNAVLWADVDNDLDLDLLISTVGGIQLYLWINDGTGHFSEEAHLRGVDLRDDVTHLVFGLAVGDYDADGYPDIVTTEWEGKIADRNKHHTKLYRNLGAEGAGFFVDATTSAGFDLVTYPPINPIFGFAPAFVDLNADGHLDITIAADFITSKLLWNQGDGTFVDGTVEAGVGTDQNGMGSTFGDFDGDGDLDWFVTAIYDPDATCESHRCSWGPSGNRLYANNGDGTFSDATDFAGVRDGAWGWGAVFLDHDNDGDLDLVMTNGADFPYSIEGNVDLLARFRRDAMRFWENDGTGTMTEVSAAVGVTDDRTGKGLLTFDYDRDGDLDLFVVNNSGTPVLYRNDGGNERDWLRVVFRVAKRPFEGLNAIVNVQAIAEGPVQIRHMGVSSHFLGQSERVAHFGLGGRAEDLVHEVRVQWPRSGIEQIFNNVPRNQVLEIEAPTLEVFPKTLPRYHASDYLDQDWKITLSELLRLVQLFHSAGYHTNESSEDGFGAGPGPIVTAHSADYKPQDGEISLSELLRVVQLYNVGGHRPEALTEDGYGLQVYGAG